MPISSGEFLSQAKALAQPTCPEVDNRTSMSRAYYCAYHSAIPAAEYCPENAHFVIESGIHTRLINRFEIFEKSHPLASKGLSIAYTLKQLKYSRILADYQLTRIVTEDDAQAQLALTDLLLNRISSFITEAQPSVA